jgi:hypothetical protein
VNGNPDQRRPGRDGLSDGFEAGESVTDENGATYFRPRSDPNKADTDDDGLDDLAEFEYGADPDPLTPAATDDINLAKIGREILAGAVFGETGLPDGSFYWLVGEETASSPFYMVGWIGFSCLPVVGGVADIRDAVQAILNGDAIGAAMNAAGAIPGPGDGIKITDARGNSEIAPVQSELLSVVERRRMVLRPDRCLQEDRCLILPL